MPHSQHAHNFHSALRWLAAGRTAAQLVSWVMTVLIIRLLSPADYGLAAMVATVTALITIIAEFGFSVAIVQAKEITREQLASVFGAAIIFALLASLAVAGLAPLAASFYNEAELTPLLQVAALNFLILALGTVADGELRRNNRFDRLAVADFSSTLAASLITYGLALADFGVWALLLGQLAASAIRIILIQLMAPNFILPSLRLKPALHLIRFGGQIALSRIAGYATTQSDLLIAGRFLGKDALGFYYVAIDLAMLPLSKIMNIVNQAGIPSLARIHRENLHSRSEILLRSLKLIAYVMLPSLWGIAAISPSIVPQLLGSHWSDSIVPLQIICLALPLRVISVLMSTAIIAYGRSDIELANNLTIAAIFPVCFLAGAQYGLIGFAAAWCVALPISVGINISRAGPVLELTHLDILAGISKPALISGLMSCTVILSAFLLGDTSKTWIGITSLITEGIFVYSILLWITDRSAALALLGIALPKLITKIEK